MPTSLRKYLLGSGLVHLLAFIILVLSPRLSFHSNPFRQDKVVWVQLPKGPANAIGSNIKKSKELPQSTIEEQKRLPPAPPKKPEMAYREKTKPTKITKKPPPKTPVKSAHQKKIDDVLSRLSREVSDRGKAAPPEAAQVPEAPEGGFTFGDPTAQYVPLNDPEYIIYQAKIRQQIMDEWILPLKYADPTYGLICKIIVHINGVGTVTETAWEQKSGMEAFDLSAMRAVEKASPLAAPPDKLKWEVLNEGFIVEFNPQNAKGTM